MGDPLSREAIRNRSMERTKQEYTGCEAKIVDGSATEPLGGGL